MPSQDSFVVGFVSSGNPHSRMHMRTLEVLPEVETIHLCGLEGEDMDALASESSKVTTTTESLDELLKRGVDALLVSVRNDQCPAILDAAVEAGIPAIFEKPGALTATRLRGIADAARAENLTMGTMLTWRNNPIVVDAKQAMDGGALGEVMAVESRQVTSQVRYRNPEHWLFDKSKAGSGILSWLGCHHIDMLCFLLDDRIESVAAMLATKNPYPIDVEDTACLVFKFSGGVIGTMHAGYHLVGSASGYAGATNDSFMALRGTEGNIRIPTSDKEGFTVNSIAEGWASGGVRGRTFAPPDSPAYGGVAGEEFVSQFLAASRTGAPALAPIESIVHVLEVIEAAVESSETGRTVEVNRPR
jgi:predicted dehydrogenase